MLAECGLSPGRAAGAQRKLTIIRRPGRKRAWANEAEVLEAAGAWARWRNWTAEIVTFGRLEPCEQLAAVADTTLLFGMYSAEMALAAFMPPRSGLLEVEARCARQVTAD